MSDNLLNNDSESSPANSEIVHSLPSILRYANIKLFGGKEFFTHTTVDQGNIHQHNFFEISEMLMFSNSHYFSTLFKKHTGMSPGEYKQRGWRGD